MRGTQRDKLPVTEGLPQCFEDFHAGQLEARQCHSISAAANCLRAKKGKEVGAAEATADVQKWRLDTREDAKRAEGFVGAAEAYIAITESDVRMFCRGAVSLGRDEGYQCLADFLPAAPRGSAVHAIRADPWGRARLEGVAGENYDCNKGLDAWLLMTKGHIQALASPELEDGASRGDFAAGRSPAEVPAAGWEARLRDALKKDPRPPGNAARRCPRCRAELTERKDWKAGEEANLERRPSAGNAG